MYVIKKAEVREVRKISKNVYAGCVYSVEFNLTLLHSSNNGGKLR
jgi:hypothetical protein